MAVLTPFGFRSALRRRLNPVIAAVLLMASVIHAQVDMDESGATWEGGRLVLEEITIRGELRTPQALFMMLKATPSLRNVLLERSFIEDVIRPVYPGAFSDEPPIGAGREMIVFPAWIRYGSVAVLGSLSVYRYYQNDDEQGLIFGVAAGLDLVGNLVLDLVGR
ncbi:MAG: hypothetical protein AVO35_10645 [Candidatus Aegiribacteria sp. MLS_C]|nr:MAG: hypothetical protein AVO35_10645 [Candidatus Aegiribacteria sp. MLS_C]